ncbi:hypothetical protein [Agromyces silvae]|uniref:hypothetical protein n=1 Tax=Agromyces silvae TaxID=3388266 RepID=UPI00280A871A|nr:hypothetical protein [Agromyces protaetiae]
MSGQESDHMVDARIAEFRRNVTAALAGRPISEVAANAGLHPDEVIELISGGPAADLFVLARLEATLGVALWPRPGAPGGSTR